MAISYPGGANIATDDLPPSGSGPEDNPLQQKTRRGERAFGKLPNSVALNPSVNAATLIMLAYRTTWINWDQSTHGHNSVVRDGGLGRNVVERANAQAVALGLLDRHQPGGRPGSKYRHAVEALKLPPPGEAGQRIVRRSWFTGVLSKIELATLLYIRAAGRVLRRDLAKRFGWSPTTAKLALDGLAGIVVEHPTRTKEGAFGPTFYVAIPRVPTDLLSVLTAHPDGRAPKSNEPVKPHHQNPGHETRGHGNPGHVRSYAEDLSELNLAALDSENPPPTSRSEELLDATDAPPAAVSSARGEDLPSAKSDAPIALRHWARAAFFQARGDVTAGEAAERPVVGLADWRELLDAHGGAPHHLRTPAAKEQAVALAAYVCHMVDGLDPNEEFLVLDAIAFYIADACRKGTRIRSLAFIGIPLVRDALGGDLAMVFDRPTSLDPQRYAKISNTVDGWLDNIREGVKGFPITAAAMRATHQIERLSALVARYSLDKVAAGINRAIDRYRARGTLAPELAVGHRICGWGWFERDIEAVTAGVANEPVSQVQQPWQGRRTLQPDEQARASEVAKALIEKLSAAGVPCNTAALLNDYNLVYLTEQLRHHVVLDDLLAAADLHAAQPRQHNQALARFDRLGPKAREIAKKREQSALQVRIAPIRDAATAALDALEAAGIAVDRQKLLRKGQMEHLDFRCGQSNHSKIMAEAVRRYVAGTKRASVPLYEWQNMSEAIREARAHVRDNGAGDAQG